MKQIFWHSFFPAQAVRSCHNFAHTVWPVWPCLSVIYLHRLQSHSWSVISTHHTLHLHHPMFSGLPVIPSKNFLLFCHEFCCYEFAINEFTQPSFKTIVSTKRISKTRVCLSLYICVSNHLSWNKTWYGKNASPRALYIMISPTFQPSTILVICFPRNDRVISQRNMVSESRF